MTIVRASRPRLCPAASETGRQCVFLCVFLCVPMSRPLLCPAASETGSQGPESFEANIQNAVQLGGGGRDGAVLPPPRPVVYLSEQK